MSAQIIRGFSSSVHKKLLLWVSSGIYDTNIPISSLLGMRKGEHLKSGPCTAYAKNGEISLTLIVQRSEVKTTIPRDRLKLL